MYIKITGKVFHYYDECISYLQVIFAVVTKMFITITGKEECILFLQVIFAVFTKKCLSHLKS